KGDMIGEGHKGTSGLGHDKTSVKMLGPHMAFLFDPFYWPDGRVGRDARRVLPAAYEDVGRQIASDFVGFSYESAILACRFPLDRSRGREAPSPRRGHRAKSGDASTDIRLMATAFRGMKLRYGPDQTDPYKRAPRCHLHRFHFIGMRSKIGH